MNTKAGHQYDLVAFDVDGTLICSSDGRVVWQLLNDRFEPDQAVARQRYHDYMEGRINYPQWVDLDLGAWVAAGATRPEMERVIVRHLRPVPGAAQTLKELRRRGYRLAVISGTLDITLRLLLPDQRFDRVFTNRVWFDEQDHIAGWEATPYDMEGKAEALTRLAAAMEIPLSRTAFVGDNINDMQVMDTAGLAVAFDPKTPEVARAADEVVHDDMRGLLELLP